MGCRQGTQSFLIGLMNLIFPLHCRCAHGKTRAIRQIGVPAHFMAMEASSPDAKSAGPCGPALGETFQTARSGA